MTNFIIDVVSDPVCPWCYIGKKRLEKAIALYQKVYPGGRSDTFQTNWTAYYLDPKAPAKGIPYRERFLQKLASKTSEADGGDQAGRAAQLTDRLASIGRQEGIVFSFAGKIGSTRSAHRAIAYSRTEAGPGAQDAFVTALFAAYFEGDADITSYADLASVAETAGLDGAAMRAWLDSGAGGAEVDAEDAAARAAGLRGVPCFTVLGRRVDGAGDVQDFMDAFVAVKEAEAEAERESAAS
ncbi:thioredoxin-like protein [Xylaria intraflava]|nr:thioredoxin-like protein [Xylaria intraflava]